MRAFKHILVAIDFSECSKSALDLAVDLAETLDADLTLVHAWEVPTWAYSGLQYPAFDIFTTVEQAARRELDLLLADTQKRLPRTKAVLRRGNGAQEIVATAAAVSADLVVTGTHGRTGAKHLFLGSVAERVVRTSPIPVLTVHGSPAKR
jgi:nucleotide-binding universal stress UspA family protein